LNYITQYLQCPNCDYTASFYVTLDGELECERCEEHFYLYWNKEEEWEIRA